MLRGDGSQSAGRNSKKRKAQAKPVANPDLANMIHPFLGPAVEDPAPSLKMKRASIRKAIQGENKEEKAMKRQRLIGATYQERFPKQTFLEQVSVSHEVAADYKKRFAGFLQYAKQTKRSIKDAAKLDECLTMYLNNMFEQGRDISEGSKTLAAVLDARPDCSQRNMMPRARRCLRGWSNMDPGSTRPPVPFAVIALIITRMLQLGHSEYALAILLMFSAYLRPGEALGIQAQDVVLPSKAVRFFAINLHPMDRLETSKTGLSDESILLDSTVLPHLGTMLGKLRKIRKVGPLFQIKYP